MKHLHVFTTGGTIDKIYFDKKNEYTVGDPVVGKLLEAMDVGFDYTVDALMRVDSLDMTDQQRELIAANVEDSESKQVLITHGTDGMVATAKKLTGISGKTVVLTGSLQPAAFMQNDAVFNIGCAVAAVQSLPHGIYIVMNGQVFDAHNVTKNLEKNRFERLAN